MNLNPEIEQRITEAADELYAAMGHATFPTVDAVRRRSKTNMNDASVAMRSWRAQQNTASQPSAATIPDAIRNVHDGALAALWNAAQELANAGLRAAQTGWEVERNESETVRSQLATAFDEQGAEFAQAQLSCQELMAALKASKEAGEAARLKTADLADECRALRADAAAAARIIAEMQSHVDDARNELDKSNARTAAVQHELDVTREKAQAEFVELKTALAIATNQAAVAGAREMAAQEEKSGAEHALLEARDMAHVLRGQVDTLTRQNSNLLDALKSS